MTECFEQRQLLSAELQQYRKVFIALGDETRQNIFMRLLEKEPIGIRVPEITKKAHLSRPAVSHHLRVLKDAGLINMHREGTMNYYYVEANNSCWHGLKELVEHVDAVVKKANNCGYPYFKEED